MSLEDSLAVLLEKKDGSSSNVTKKTELTPEEIAVKERQRQESLAASEILNNQERKNSKVRVEMMEASAEEKAAKVRQEKESEAANVLLAKKEEEKKEEVKETAEKAKVPLTVVDLSAELSEVHEKQRHLRDALKVNQKRMTQLKSHAVEQATLKLRKKKKKEVEAEKMKDEEELSIVTVPDDELTKELTEGFKESFSLFDVDGDGKIHTDDCRIVLAELKHAIPGKIIKQLEEYDTENGGLIDFSKFVQIMVMIKQMYVSGEFTANSGVFGYAEGAKPQKVLQDVKHDAKLDEELRDFAATGNIIAMKVIIMRGANINSASKKTGFTALHRACAENQVEVVEYLLEQPNIDLTIDSKVRTYLV